MRNTALMIFAAALLLTGCGQPRERSVERPSTVYRNTRTLEIAAVAVNDTATIISMEAFFRPNNWIRIVSDTYIRANGEKYMVAGSEGIELDENHFMPESGEERFTLWFPPLPKGVKSFDFIESDCDDCFKIYGIDLTGKAAFQSALPRGMADIKTPREGEVLPEAELKVVYTQVDVYVHGLPADVDFDTPELKYNNFLTANRDDALVEDLGGGRYRFTFPQYGTTVAWVTVRYSEINMVLQPGETAEVHIDIPAQGYNLSRYNEEKRPYVSFTGAYASLNNEMNLPGKSYDYNINSISQNPDAWKLDEAGYRDLIREMWGETDREFDEMGVSPQLREYYSLSKYTQALYWLNAKMYLMRMSEAKDKGEHPAELPLRDNPVTDDDRAMLAEMPFNDPAWLTEPMAGMTIRQFRDFSPAQLIQVGGGQDGLIKDSYLTGDVFRKVLSGGPIGDADLEKLDKTSTPFYREAYERMTAYLAETKQKALDQGGFTIADPPDAADARVLEAIVAQYKGEPLFIDFWATWCGPCLQAMKTIKPLKPEMADHGVTTIYISNPSSPEPRWLSMLPEIGGIHYYLTQVQWNAVSEKYGIRGIPQYMIFDKEGNKTFQTAGFPGVDRMRGELEKVW